MPTHNEPVFRHRALIPLAKKLRELQVASGKTGKQIARFLKMNQQTWYAATAARQAPNITRLGKLETLFGVESGSLVALVPSKHRTEGHGLLRIRRRRRHANHTHAETPTHLTPKPPSETTPLSALTTIIDVLTPLNAREREAVLGATIDLLARLEK